MKNKITTIIVFLLAFTMGCSDDEVLLPTNTAPTISDQSFSIEEDASVGTSLGTVVASDVDEDPLTFSIADGNSNETFQLDSLSGELTLSGMLDFGVTSSYTLSIQVSDVEGVANANITVNVIPVEAMTICPGFPGNSFFDGQLADADYWSDEPEILSAGLGFADIVGIEVDEITEALVESIGGAWASNISCADTGDRTFTNTRSNLEAVFCVRTPYNDTFKEGAIGLDALPMVLSWPCKTSTIDLSDFKITVNNGEEITPSAVGCFPNVEINERNTIVLVGEFANKRPSSDPGSRYVTKVEIVGELILIGPDGQEFNAQGLFKETFSSPYDANNGPVLVGAKINYCDPNVADGPSIQLPIPRPGNDEYALYGDILAQAQANGEVSCRIRVLTSGGFSPDGVRGVLPTDYERFFRIHALGANGATVMLDQTNVNYAVQGGTLKVIGLSDLGGKEGENGVLYDDCYDEDGDNYIDIILTGDDAAMRNITHVEVPSIAGGYSAFYNPGGPGPTPYPNVSYTAPGPPDLEPVSMALDNPMRISN
ncbi:MAG: cadherin repeat domain-containing protein [Phaeodactylibacter xiamenensis]|uniref:cadherin repeat domain-containing protein n=1 Tax=Phaeodactylibacter xiamenensis TaxID=1524460 RepID=UPI000697CA41|nr:cadherin repeat domain-containing protein [Phaeodactylibacter xiamenensis]MCR9051916.1 cadherin repeat domain-containing protein [bacterium]